MEGLLYALWLHQNKRGTQAYSDPREARCRYPSDLAGKLGQHVLRDSALVFLVPARAAISVTG
jgi:hypothetical protein